MRESWGSPLGGWPEFNLQGRRICGDRLAYYTCELPPGHDGEHSQCLEQPIPIRPDEGFVSPSGATLLRDRWTHAHEPTPEWALSRARA